MKSFQTLVVLLKKKVLLFHLNSMLFLFFKLTENNPEIDAFLPLLFGTTLFYVRCVTKNALRQNVLLAFQLNLCFWANAISKQRIVFLNDANNQLIRDLLLVQMRQLLGNNGKISTNQ